MQFVEARVAANVVEDILLRAAVVGDAADDGRQTVVVGSDGPGVAKGAEVLARVKAMGGGVTERAGEFGMRNEK